MAKTECPVSTHEFKLHDWRWLGWPLSDPTCAGRWCRLCGLVEGRPGGQCPTDGCLEYADGPNRDYCKACVQKRFVTAARSDLARKVIQAVEGEHLEDYVAGEKAGYAVARGRKDDDIAYDNAINHVVTALRELFQQEGIDVETKRC